MTDLNETNNAGIRWLSVFEQVIAALIIAQYWHFKREDKKPNCLGFLSQLYKTLSIHKNNLSRNKSIHRTLKRFTHQSAWHRFKARHHFAIHVPCFG